MRSVSLASEAGLDNPEQGGGLVRFGNEAMNSSARKWKQAVAQCEREFMRKHGGILAGSFMASFCVAVESLLALIMSDEVGQSMELEADAPTSRAGEATRIVLTGDPHQLVPWCESERFEYEVLGRSPLERLMQLPGSKEALCS